MTIRTTETNTYRVEVDDNFDVDSDLDTLHDIEGWTMVTCNIRDWSIINAEEV